MRVYAELKPLLDRDAIVVIDAGDFGSYAGRVIDSYVPGAWLDSGPFGCLGSGPGYALAAKLARPDRQVVLLQGDGAFGFSGMEWDTLVRHGVHVVSVIGNNGIWALEKHPMELLYGYSVVAELRPGTRYDEVVTALGGHGELVSTPAELRPALERAFASGLPAVVNTLTDPQSPTRVGRIWPEVEQQSHRFVLLADITFQFGRQISGFFLTTPQTDSSSQIVRVGPFRGRGALGDRIRRTNLPSRCCQRGMVTQFCWNGRTRRTPEGQHAAHPGRTVDRRTPYTGCRQTGCGSSIPAADRPARSDPCGRRPY